MLQFYIAQKGAKMNQIQNLTLPVVRWFHVFVVGHWGIGYFHSNGAPQIEIQIKLFEKFYIEIIFNYFISILSFLLVYLLYHPINFYGKTRL